MTSATVVDARRRILAAAPAVLRRTTYAKLTMDEVAKAAGIARQTIYKHFAGRDDLVIALFVEELLQHHAPVLAEVVARPPSAENLVEVFCTETRLARDYSLFAEVLDPVVAPRLSELVLSSPGMAEARRATWLPLLRRYAEAGVLRPGLDHVETVTWLTYQQFFFVTQPAGLVDADERLAHHVRTFLVPALVRP